MSSRAVRKALKQRALLEEQAKITKPANEPAEDSEDEEELDNASIRPKPNLFAMLGGNDGDDDVEEDGKMEGGKDDDEDEEEDEAPSTRTKTTSTVPAPSSTKKKNKKKKKKKSGKNTGEDEIDRALKELAIKSTSTGRATSSRSTVNNILTDQQLQSFLRIDPRSLDASQEMRRLFGRAAMTASNDDGDGPRRQRRSGRGGRGGFAGVLGAAGSSRGPMLGKKNIFVQPKQGWPNVGSGGLSMVVVEEGKEETEFRFQHSNAYQDVQRQFMRCVMSMDPNRLIVLLQHNPYHISTLLQVSLILTSQRDHATSGDLLERALFSFGRSVHSHFSTLLASPPPSPRPHLSFKRFENRELYLAIWRYIRNLCMRGTFRTAEEFGRLLWGLDWKSDPYAMILLLDQLALKAHLPDHVLALMTSKAITSRLPRYLAAAGSMGWPNLAYSTVLAYHQLNKPELAREYLFKAINRFPYIATRLWQVLDLESSPYNHKIPAILWGLLPPQKGGSQLLPLLTELYVERTRDLWNTPETISLFVEVAGHLSSLVTPHLSPSFSTDSEGDETIIDGIPESIARHAILSELPTVTSLLPLSWKEHISGGAEFDPLPPTRGEIVEYDMLADMGPDGAMGIPSGSGASEAGGILLQFVRALLPWVDPPGTGREGNNNNNNPPEQRQPPDWNVLADILGPERARRIRDLVEGWAGPIVETHRDVGAEAGADAVPDVPTLVEDALEVGGEAQPAEGATGEEEEVDPEFVQEVMRILIGADETIASRMFREHGLELGVSTDDDDDDEDADDHNE